MEIKSEVVCKREARAGADDGLHFGNNSGVCYPGRHTSVSPFECAAGLAQNAVQLGDAVEEKALCVCVWLGRHEVRMVNVWLVQTFVAENAWRLL